MKQGIAVVLVLALIAGAGWWILQDKAATEQQRDGATAPAVSPGAGTADADLRQPGSSESDEVLAARQRIADATLALEAATLQRKAAEVDMQAAERELEELERWIADIEERGEDPVDYAEEGLARLQPAFFAYEDAFERFELAESMEAEAAGELAAANAALSNAIAASGGEK